MGCCSSATARAARTATMMIATTKWTASRTGMPTSSSSSALVAVAGAAAGRACSWGRRGAAELRRLGQRVADSRRGTPRGQAAPGRRRAGRQPRGPAASPSWPTDCEALLARLLRGPSTRRRGRREGRLRSPRCSAGRRDQELRRRERGGRGRPSFRRCGDSGLIAATAAPAAAVDRAGRGAVGQQQQQQQ